MLNVKRDLIGKTITGVIAVPGRYQQGQAERGHDPCELWMLQFSDGTYVEFVSPGARRGLNRSTRPAAGSARDQNHGLQLALNVA